VPFYQQFSISISEGLVQQARQAETDDKTVRNLV
jgi:hypothetical protein